MLNLRGVFWGVTVVCKFAMAITQTGSFVSQKKCCELRKRGVFLVREFLLVNRQLVVKMGVFFR